MRLCLIGCVCRNEPPQKIGIILNGPDPLCMMGFPSGRIESDLPICLVFPLWTRGPPERTEVKIAGGDSLPHTPHPVRHAGGGLFRSLRRNTNSLQPCPPEVVISFNVNPRSRENRKTSSGRATSNGHPPIQSTRSYHPSIPRDLVSWAQLRMGTNGFRSISSRKQQAASVTIARRAKSTSQIPST